MENQDRFRIRIYDKKRNIMITEDNCFELEEKHYKHDEWWGTIVALTVTAISNFLECWNKDNRFVIMQSTGLKVNGKLLFEGDVVLVQERNEYFVVVWDNATAEFMLRNIYKIGEGANMLFGSSNREIIGNIYEHKEQLKQIGENNENRRIEEDRK